MEHPATPDHTCRRGRAKIAVSGGAVWAINPDSTVSRIDERSGRLIATVLGVSAVAVAAGKEGVWVDDGKQTLSRIDTRSSTVATRIRLTGSGLAGIANRRGRRLGCRSARRNTLAHRSRPTNRDENDPGRTRRDRRQLRRRCCLGHQRLHRHGSPGQPTLQRGNTYDSDPRHAPRRRRRSGQRYG